MKYVIKITSLCSFLILSLGCKTSEEKEVKDGKIEEAELIQAPETLDELFKNELKPFYYGVASGDPLQDAVILWTHISGNNSQLEVTWQISTDSLFAENLKSGRTSTSPKKDFTVKVDVDGLDAGTEYFYRFISGKDTSIVGRTRTAPKNSEKLTFAIASCANYTKGFFNAYARIAEENLDAVIFLGDYIYEYGSPRPEHLTANRAHIPNYEIKSLDDYRTRYALYRLDDDLRDLHKQHPFIAVWDDHEFANNTYTDGAQNHSEDEGDFQQRKANAKQAYYEWLPIRETGNHYRSFNYGNLADVFMLDERIAGRTKPLGYNNPERQLKTHSILGNDQFNWLEEGLLNSKSQWKLIGNQVIFSYQKFDNPDRLFNMDSWNGYPVDQKRLINFLRYNTIDNTIFLSGDTHSAWSFEVTGNPLEGYNAETSEGAVAVEFAVASINSGNHNETFPDSLVIEHEKRLMSKNYNPHLKYVNRRDHGYVLLTLTENSATVEYKIINSRKEKNSKITVDTSFTVKSGTHKLN